MKHKDALLIWEALTRAAEYANTCWFCTELKCNYSWDADECPESDAIYKTTEDIFKKLIADGLE